MLLSRLPLICAVLLAVILTGSIYWQTAPILKPETLNTTLTQTKNTSTLTKNNAKAIHNIARFKLFGDANLKTAKATIVEKNLPKTKLKLILTGVLVSPSNEGAGALILGPDKQTQHYKINDELPGGATLKQVFPDRVIVNRSGRLENLYFVETKSLGIERFTPDEEPEAIRPQQSSAQARNDGNLSNARSQSIKSRLSKLKKRLLKNKQ